MRSLALCTLFAAPLVFLGACSKTPPVPPEQALSTEVSQFRVRGKVTHNGAPIPFGFVAFYSTTSVDKSGKTARPSVAEIAADGTYDMANAPLGPVMVCVFTDPEMDINSAFEVGSFMPGGAPGPGGGPPGPGGPGGGPPGPGGPGGGPPGGPKMPAPKRPGTTERVEKLSDAEKKALKDLNAKYGTFGRSPLAFAVAGQSDQTFNIELSLGK